MSAEFCAAIIAHLKADAGLAALIGDRIYSPLVSQRKNYPYLVLSSVSVGSSEGSLDSLDPVINEQWQFDAIAKTRQEASKIAWKVERIFRDFFTGEMGGFWIFSIRSDGITDLSDLEVEGGQQLIWRYGLRVGFRRALDANT